MFFFSVIINSFQVYDEPHQMLNEKNYIYIYIYIYHQ